MPEWILDQALPIILLATASVVLWKQNEVLRKENRELLRQSIEADQDRTNQIASMADILTSVRRALQASHKQLRGELTFMKDQNTAIHLLLQRIVP